MRSRRHDAKAARRPIGYWQEFNEWYRGQLQTGDRPPVEIVASWYEENAPRVWPLPDERPTWKETRLHAKCLRSTDEVKTYFQRYRAGKKERRIADVEPQANTGSFVGYANEPARHQGREMMECSSLASLVSQHNARVARIALGGQGQDGSADADTHHLPRAFSLSTQPFSPEGAGSPQSSTPHAYSPQRGPPTALTVTTGIQGTASVVKQEQGTSLSQVNRQHTAWQQPAGRSSTAIQHRHPAPPSWTNDFPAELREHRRTGSFLGSDRSAAGSGGSLRSASMFAVRSAPAAEEEPSGLRCKSMFVSRSDFPTSMDLDNQDDDGPGFSYPAPSGPGFSYPAVSSPYELLHDFSCMENPAPHGPRPSSQQGGPPPTSHSSKGKVYGDILFQRPSAHFTDAPFSSPGGDLAASFRDLAASFPSNEITPRPPPHTHRLQSGHTDNLPSTLPYGHAQRQPWLVESGATTPAGEVGIPVYIGGSADWGNISGSSSGSGGICRSSDGEHLLPKLETLLAIKQEDNAALHPHNNPNPPPLTEVPSWLPSSHLTSGELSAYLASSQLTMTDMLSWIPSTGIPENPPLPDKEGGKSPTPLTLVVSGPSAADFPDRVQASPTGMLPSPTSLGPSEFPSLIRRKAGLQQQQQQQLQQSPRQPRLYYEHIFKRQDSSYGAVQQQPPGSTDQSTGVTTPHYYPNLLCQTRSASVQSQNYMESLQSPRGSCPVSWGGTVVTTCQPGVRSNSGPRKGPQSPFLSMTVDPSTRQQMTQEPSPHSGPHSFQQFHGMLEQRATSQGPSPRLPAPHSYPQQRPLLEQRSHSVQALPYSEGPEAMSEDGKVDFRPVVDFSAAAADCHRRGSEGNVAEQFYRASKEGLPASCRLSDASGSLYEDAITRSNFARTSHAEGYTNRRQLQQQATDELMEWRRSQSFDWIQSLDGHGRPEQQFTPLEGLSSLQPSWRSGLEVPLTQSDTGEPISYQAVAGVQADENGPLAPHSSRPFLEMHEDYRRSSLNPAYREPAGLGDELDGTAGYEPVEELCGGVRYRAPDQGELHLQDCNQQGVEHHLPSASPSQLSHRSDPLPVDMYDCESPSHSVPQERTSDPCRSTPGNLVTTAYRVPHSRSSGSGSEWAGQEGGSFVSLPAHLRSPGGGASNRSMSCLLPPVSRCLKQPGSRK